MQETNSEPDENRTIMQGYFADETWMISAEEIRQYFFCPRIPYFRHVGKFYPQYPYMVSRGKDTHEKIVRSTPSQLDLIRKYLPKGQNWEIYHDYYIEAPKLHLLGRLDAFVIQSDQIRPVEVKTGHIPKQHRRQHQVLQLTAQSLLLEHHFSTFIDRAFIIYLDEKQGVSITITFDMKQRLFRAIRALRQAFQMECIPKPTSHAEKCYGCEYWPYCKRI